MKVLLANKYFYQKGGAENSFFETAGLLEKKGHEVVFFSMKHPKNRQSAYEPYFVPQVDYEKMNLMDKVSASARLLYSFEAKRRIEHLLQDSRPDIAHLNNIYHQISPSILHSLKKNRIPSVMTLRDYKVVCASYSMVSEGKICEACRGGQYYKAFTNSCVKESRLKSLLSTAEMYLHHNLLKIYDLVDVFISPSEFLIRKVHDMGFRGRVEYLPNFTTLDDYAPENSWTENSAVYFGRISKEKGLRTAIEAFKGLPIDLKIIGDGPLKEPLEKEYAASPNVRFLGYKNGTELHDEIRKSMFVVLPSEWYENNPRTVLEGFALGKPAVGSRVGGIPELVKDGLTGLTYEMGNVKDLRSKLEFMLNNPEDIKRMGASARRLVENELHRDRHYEKLMQIYRSAMN